MVIKKELYLYRQRSQLKISIMGKRVVTVNVARYYSKMTTVEIEVDDEIVDDELVDYLTESEELHYLFEEELYQASMSIDDTTYEFQDTVNNFGGTL